MLGAERRASEGPPSLQDSPPFSTWSPATVDLVPLMQTLSYFLLCLSYFLLCPKTASSLGPSECPRGPHPAQSPGGATLPVFRARQGTPAPPTAAAPCLLTACSVSRLLARALNSGHTPGRPLSCRGHKHLCWAMGCRKAFHGAPGLFLPHCPGITCAAGLADPPLSSTRHVHRKYRWFWTGQGKRNGPGLSSGLFPESPSSRYAP